MKYCRQCGELLPLSEFYIHKAMADGHLNQCKSCVKNRVRKHRVENIESVRAYDRKRSKLPHRIELRRLIVDRWTANYPGRRKAVNAVNNAVRDGRLRKMPCWVCGELEVEAHHPSYSMPLDVVWLCVPHHRQLHAGV